LKTTVSDLFFKLLNDPFYRSIWNEDVQLLLCSIFDPINDHSKQRERLEKLVHVEVKERNDGFGSYEL